MCGAEIHGASTVPARKRAAKVSAAASGGTVTAPASRSSSSGGGGYVMHHIGLSCDDPIAIERWYTKHFGFTRGRVYAPGPDQVVMIQAGGVYLELFKSSTKPPVPKAGEAGPEYSGFRHFAFLVDDLDAKLAELGDEARITLGPLDMSQYIPDMRVAWVADPEGNIVELNQGYRDEEAPPPLDEPA